MTATEIKTHNEYTVGWVCALPKEQTAATAMLDQRHDNLPKPANDSNTYTLGSVGKHNVVIACLPKGHIGNNSAATVAAQMVSTFPSVRFGLMVGIGGGIPPKVRLGDVVVSTPVGSFPGVVQWDRGKAKDGSFEWKGSLNNPPSSLLTALTKLETGHELVGSKIPEFLDQLKQKWPRLVAKYLKSDSLEDILFKSDYNHVCRSTTEDQVFPDSDYESEEEESCRYCDKTKVVKRKPRDMRVHYGLIASGNQVIKSATRRDQLNKDLGGNLLCVEMEAAGLMNNFPCIVIRGICDYADSHKNKDWQEYAAAVAAAFAKELLAYVSSSDVYGERAVKYMLGDVLTSVSATNVDVSYIKSRLDKDEILQIVQWITSTDYGPQQSDFLQKRQPGTGKWLLDSKEYQTWLGARKQTLFCPGIPGAGKTILTSIVVDHLERSYRADSTTGIVYIYCNYRRQEEQVIERLLASLLKQLSQGQDSLPDCLRDFYEAHIDKRTRPSLDEIQTSLHSVAENYSTVFVVVDALDECQNLDGSRQKFLTELFSLQEKYGWNFFVTSRVIPEIVDRFNKTSISLEIRASTEDIERYLKGNTAQLPSFVQQNQELQQKIATEITKAVDGMFLLAQIYLNSLNDKITPKAIRNALSSFQKATSGSGETEKTGVLAHAYEQAMLRINGQQPGFKDLAYKVLLWIVCAERRLTTTELQHALAVEIDESELDKENLPSVQDMVSVCAGLITVDYKSNIIRLVHYTTQEYFNQTRKRWFPDADIIMADTCAFYLLCGFEEGVCQKFRKWSKLYPLYSYASQNWGHHARKAAKLCHKVMELLECETKMNASIEAVKDEVCGFLQLGQNSARGLTSLHVAAYFGIEEAVKALLKKTMDVSTKDDIGSTPLLWSACNGHEAIVELFLAIPSVEVTCNFRSGRFGDTPLSIAARNGHEAVVKLLLAVPSIDINSTNPWRGGPLFKAAQYGHDAVVKLLLTAGADPNLGNKYQTPLSKAAEEGHKDIVKLLLTMPNININSSWDPYYGTPLFRAACKGYNAIVELLLSAGADPNLGNKCQTPLDGAVEEGHKDVVKLLLAMPNININPSTDPHYGTPLFRATDEEHTAVVKLLLAAGAGPDLRSQFGTTLLMLAAKHEEMSLVEMLLAAGADPNLRDQLGSPLLCAVAKGHDAVVRLLLAARVDLDSSLLIRSALHIAAIKGYVVVVELFLAAGADLNIRDKHGRTPLFHAVYRQREAAAKLLLTAGADPDLNDKNGTTPLSLAAGMGYESVIKLLLAAGADLNIRDKHGRTPLFHTIYKQHEAAVKLLLTAGADPDLSDENGATPLSLAAYMGYKPDIKLLLAAGAEINARDKHGRTPLFHIIYKQLQVAARADRDLRYRSKRKSGRLALNDNYKEVVELFLAAGATPDLINDNGKTPLVYAARGGSKVIVEILLTAGADPDLSDNEGETPLFHAARYRHEAVVELLLAAGADQELRNRRGQTPLSMAQERGHEAVVKLLSRGPKVDLVHNVNKAESSTSVESQRKRKYDEVE